METRKDESMQEQEIDLIELFYKLLIHWKWFAVTVPFALFIALIYVNLSIPVYKASASIIIKDSDTKDKMLDELFSTNSPALSAAGTQMEDEMEIMRSRSILSQVVDELNLHTIYKVKKGGRYLEEVYCPLRATLDKEAMDTLSSTLSIEIERTESGFEVRSEQANKQQTTTFTGFPAFIDTPAGRLTLRCLSDEEFPEEMEISILCLPDAVRACSSKLTVATTSKKTSIIGLSYTDIDKRRAEAFLSKLIEVYNRDALADKNKVAGNTLVFIEERLDSISGELGFVEKHMEQYKVQERVSDIKTNMALDLSTNNEYEKKLLEVETQLNMTNSIYNYVENSKHSYSLLPVNTGISDTGLLKLIDEYNKELLERERLLYAMKDNNPAIINQNIKIDVLKRNVVSALAGVREGLLIERNDIMQKTNYFNSRIMSIPKQEREFNNINRQQQIKANLYLMLLERKEQAAISLAATINKARIIDAALAEDVPVSPKRKVIYVGAAFLALCLTAGFIFLKDAFRTKIGSASEVEKTQLPIMGMIPQISESEKQVMEGRNNILDEAFRRTRTNLRFITESEEKRCILVTSTVSGDGKSFVSINLALTFAFMGCKVLLVGLDLRKPRLAEYFGLNTKQGMSYYLSGNETQLDNLILPSGLHPLLSVAPAGPIPPNPAELLETDKLKEAFVYFREHFDYVIVDSAPVGMVSDSLCLGRVTDFTLFVCRMNCTPKSALSLAVDLDVSEQINSVSFIINGCKVSDKKYSYGYGYGYSYGSGNTK